MKATIKKWITGPMRRELDTTQITITQCEFAWIFVTSLTHLGINGTVGSCRREVVSCQLHFIIISILFLSWLNIHSSLFFIPKWSTVGNDDVILNKQQAVTGSNGAFLNAVYICQQALMRLDSYRYSYIQKIGKWYGNKTKASDDIIQRKWY